MHQGLRHGASQNGFQMRSLNRTPRGIVVADRAAARRFT
jgi:hypothetical protein